MSKIIRYILLLIWLTNFHSVPKFDPSIYQLKDNKLTDKSLCFSDCHKHLNTLLNLSGIDVIKFFKTDHSGVKIKSI